jgi:hypothetical protein
VFSKSPFSLLRASTLCRREVSPANSWQMIGWWEARRIPFNLIVGTAGLITCIVVAVVGFGSFFLFNGDFGMPNPPLFGVFGVLIYGMVANIFYTGGWLSELILRKIWPNQADRFATLTFSLGLVFSVLLTLSPGIVAGAVGIFELLRHGVDAIHSHAR